MKPALLIARKESGELLLSVRGLAWLVAVSGALSVFSLLLIGSSELSLLDNAQIVYDMAGLVTALGCLLALIVGIDGTAGERDRGSFTLLLLLPMPRQGVLIGKLAGILMAWAAMYVMSVPYLWAVGSTGQNLTQGAQLLALVGTPVVVTFGFFGTALGTWLSSFRAALMVGLISLIVSASPLLLGPSLRQSAVGRIFDAVNPFSGALNAYDAVIIDSQSIMSQWQHYLPVAVCLLVMLWLAVRGFARITR